MFIKQNNFGKQGKTKETKTRETELAARNRTLGFIFKKNKNKIKNE